MEQSAGPGQHEPVQARRFPEAPAGPTGRLAPSARVSPVTGGPGWPAGWPDGRCWRASAY